jgi:hypothetical protein
MLFSEHSKSVAEMFGPTIFFQTFQFLHGRAMPASSRTKRDCTRTQTVYSLRLSVILTVRWKVRDAQLFCRSSLPATYDDFELTRDSLI